MGKDNIKLTTKTFITKAKNIHRDKYDYTLVNYINAHTKIKIVCPEHGVFEQTPNSHLCNHGCAKCAGVSGYSTEDFIKESQSIYGNRYDYSLVEYISSHKKVKIICPEHGVFEKSLIKHRYQGCPKCKKDTRKYHQEDFIERSNKIHHNKYDYSLVNYVNTEINVDIICPKHGVFNQHPRVHSTGSGCPKCRNEKQGKYKLLNKNIFSDRSKKIHKDKYDYSLVSYKNSVTKVKIICKKHGIFEQLPSSHLNGCGCPSCQISKGEEKIKSFLDRNEITYKKEHIFKECRYILPLKFDFYLPNYNMCIEYDGEQHFNKWHSNDSDKNLSIRISRDMIKNDYCKNNNINILRIKYTQFNKIDTILTEKLKNNN